MAKKSYVAVDPIAIGGAINPITLSGTASSARREVILKGQRIGYLEKVFSGWHKGRKVFAWNPLDATGRRIPAPPRSVPGFSEAEAMERVVSAQS
jgi:hypothetical protein